MPILHRFHGGIHPPEHKSESNSTPIASLPLPPRLSVPVRQSLGNPARVTVKVGQRVLRGQCLAEADGLLSVAVHAPTSGEVVAIGEGPLAHASGLPDQCIEIRPDGRDEALLMTAPDWTNLPLDAVREYLQQQGVVGQGGAVFPSHLKLPRQSGLKTLIINGAECEPMITCDDRLMRESAADVVAGALLLKQMTGAESVLIGVEDNKPEAIAALQLAAGNRLTVAVIPTLYPSGGARQLIRVLTGVEVPSGVRSTEFGIQCFNVATAASVHRALSLGEPVLERIVTVTGAVARPGNYRVRVGTPIQWLLEQAGAEPAPVIVGGPLMGFELVDVQAPVDKATNCLVVKRADWFPPKPQPQPCIRCGDCATVCPAELQPMDLYWFAKARQFDKARHWDLFDCIECGACSYVCPSQIPLVQFYQFAKSEIREADQQKQAASVARERHEFRQFRLERDKAEKAARLAAKASAKHQEAARSSEPEDAVRAAKIKAAMDRAANKSADQATPAPEAELSAEEKRARIQEVMLRSQQQREAALAQQAMPSGNAELSADEKRAKIQAALARAQQQREAASPPAPTGNADLSAEEKRARIAAAMARAAQQRADAEATRPAPPNEDHHG